MTASPPNCHRVPNHIYGTRFHPMADLWVSERNPRIARKGATIVGQGAGELIGGWAMAISGGDKVNKFAQSIMPYPTRSEISKRAAGAYYTPKLYSDWTKRIVRFLSRFG